MRASSYPNLITDNFTTISVGAFLVTYDYNLQSTVDHLVRFARSLCQQFPVLQEKGHPKWREVNLALPGLNKGWTYYGPTANELRRCIAARKPAIVVPGHLAAGAALDVSAVTYTRDYLLAFEEEAAKAADSAALIAAMKRRYPSAGLAPALEIGAKVVKGEMKWG